MLTSFVPESLSYFGIAETKSIIPICPSVDDIFDSQRFTVGAARIA